MALTTLILLVILFGGKSTSLRTLSHKSLLKQNLGIISKDLKFPEYAEFVKRYSYTLADYYE